MKVLNEVINIIVTVTGRTAVSQQVVSLCKHSLVIRTTWICPYVALSLLHLVCLSHWRLGSWKILCSGKLNFLSSFGTEISVTGARGR